MASGQGQVSRLRGAVSRSVLATSLRHVARDVGMSPTGLQKFISGAQPYSATMKKLVLWYARSGQSPDRHSALAALEVLVQELPPAERQEAMERILLVLETWNQEKTRTVPVWILELRSQIGLGEPE